MILNNDTAKKTAELLLQVKAIKLEPQKTFTWASGWKSPIYCDNRIILSFPSVRNYVCEQLATQLLDVYTKPDVIAGVATGAIGIGMLVANYLDLPFVYVRPEPKKHGRQNQVEGQLQKGQSVIVIEDLISTGKSSLNAIKALEREGANVKAMLAVFSYGFDVANQNFKDYNVHTLSNYDFLIEQAYQTDYLTKEEFETLKSWRSNPANWKK